MLSDLLARNRAWSRDLNARTPGYFQHLATRQSPEYFWIGCSDSRVPANVVVHRNVANVVHSTDLNLLSALEFAVDTLSIREIIICGHFGCGGVRAATEDLPHGLADHWLEPIRRLARQYTIDLAQEQTQEQRRDRLAETPILQRAWARGEQIAAHGLIYGLKDGLLRNLDCTVGHDNLTGEGTE